MATLELMGGILLHLAWQGSLVGVAAAIALRLAGPTTSRIRYRIALAGLGLIATAPVATVARGDGLLADWQLASPVADWVAPVLSPPPGEVLPQPAAPRGALPNTGDVLSQPARDRVPGNPLALFGMLWVAGAVAFLARLAGGIIQVHRIRAAARAAPQAEHAVANELWRIMGGRAPISVLLSDRVDIPFAAGIRRPAVLLPEGIAATLSPERIRAVLAHELAHVRRHDYAVNLVQRMIEAIFLFHPVVHWLSRVARDEREHCCDLLAASMVGDRRAVAGALLALEETRSAHSPHWLLPAADGGSLLRRIERLVSQVPSPRRGWAIASAAVLVATGATMVVATPAQPGVVAPAGNTAGAESAGSVVWEGELRAGQRLRVRTLAGSIKVVRGTGSGGRVRAIVAGAPAPDLTFQATRTTGGVTVCAVRARYNRCEAEGSTWFGPPDEMRRTRIDLWVELPARVGVTAATFDGDLVLDDVDADAEARTGSGTISARIVESAGTRPSRTLDFHTGDGTVQVQLPARFGGELEARLSNGMVRHVLNGNERVVFAGGLVGSSNGFGVRTSSGPTPFGVLGEPRHPAKEGRTSLGPGGHLLRVSSGRGDLVLSLGN